jgi:hypothetical protein
MTKRICDKFQNSPNMYPIAQDMANLPPFRLKSYKPLCKEEFLIQTFSKSDYWKAARQDVDIFNKNLIRGSYKTSSSSEPGMANAIICYFTGKFVITPLVNAVQKKKPSNTLWKNVPLLNSSKVSPNFI